MVIGVDFDNTIVRYDDVFHRVALDLDLIPADIRPAKSEVRDYLRSIGREEAWTELQGLVYGDYIHHARPFPGVLDFLRRCREKMHTVYIISFKSRFPVRGRKCDLHGAAREWLEKNSFYDPDGPGLKRDNVFFELTKEEKLARIGSAGCDCFIDDLPEFLSDSAFPERVKRILFDPNGSGPDMEGIVRYESWDEITRRIV